MRFKSLEIQNFLSYIQSILVLESQGVVLVSGHVLGDASADSSGSGKSALVVEGLLWALFGRTLRGIKGDDVVNRHVGRDCLARVIFTDDKHRMIEVVRTQKHTEKSHIIVNGTKHVGATEIDRILRDILGIGFDAFTASIVIGNGGARCFTQLTDAQQKEVLEDLLGLQRIQEFAQTTKLCRDACLDDILTTTAEQRQRLAVLEEKKAIHQRLSSMAQEFAAQSAARITTLAEERAAVLSAYGQGIDDLETVHHKQHESAARHRECTAQVTECEATYERAFAAQQVKEDALFFAKHAQDLVLRDLERLTALSGACPTCLQVIRPEVIEQEVQRLQDHSDALAEEIRAQQAEFDAYTERVVFMARDGLEDAHQRRAALNIVISELTVKHDLLQQQSVAHEQTIKSLTDQIAVEQERTNTAQAEAEQVSQAIQVLEHSLEAKAQRLVKLEEQSRQIDFWVHGFSNEGIKSTLLQDVVPFLDSRALYYADLLTDGAMSVKFSTYTKLKNGKLKEKFDVQVQYNMGGSSWLASSQGQRGRANLVCAMALGDLAATRISQAVNLLVLDEIFDGLDATGMERAIQMLYAIEKDKDSIFVITHQPSFADRFSSVLHIAYEDGLSRIV